MPSWSLTSLSLLLLVKECSAITAEERQGVLGAASSAAGIAAKASAAGEAKAGPRATKVKQCKEKSSAGCAACVNSRTKSFIGSGNDCHYCWKPLSEEQRWWPDWVARVVLPRAQCGVQLPVWCPKAQYA